MKVRKRAVGDKVIGRFTFKALNETLFKLSYMVNGSLSSPCPSTLASLFLLILTVAFVCSLKRVVLSAFQIIRSLSALPNNS